MHEQLCYKFLLQLSSHFLLKQYKLNELNYVRNLKVVY